MIVAFREPYESNWNLGLRTKNRALALLWALLEHPFRVLTGHDPKHTDFVVVLARGRAAADAVANALAVVRARERLHA